MDGLCEICNNNHATIHITEIEGGQAVDHHYCEECAKKQGKLIQETVTPQELLAKLVQVLESRSEESESLRCPECGISWGEFQSGGRLGCSHDYEAFHEKLLPLLEKMHGSTVHQGRAPAGRGSPEGDRVRRVLQLQRELDRAVKEEAYERAAKIRDEIYRLRQEEGDESS